MSLAARSTRGALFLGASTIINITVGFFGGILLARILNPNDFGTFALASTLNAFLDVRVKLQLDQKFIRDQDERHEYLDTFFTLSAGLAGISFLCLIIAAIGALILNRPDLAVCLVVISLLNLLDPLTATIRLSIEKQVAFRAVSFIQTLASLMQFLATLVAALAGWGLWSLLVGNSVGIGINLVLFWRIAPRRPSLCLDRSLAREFLNYGIRYGFVYATSAIVLTQFDNFIVGLAAGTFALGFYDRAYRTSLWPTLLVSAALGRISLPTYSKLQDDTERLKRAFSFVLWTVLTLTTPIGLILLVTAPELVPTVYGSKWLPSIPILQLLAAFAICRPLWDDMISLLVATKHSQQMARLVFIQAVVMVVLTVPLTFLYGGAGTAVSVGVAFSISAIFLFYWGHTRLKVNLYEAAGLPLLNNLLALVGYLLFRFTLPWELLPPLAQLGGQIAVLLVLYALVSLVTSRQIIINRAHYLAQAIRG